MTANTPQRVDVERFDLHGVSYVRSTDHDARITALLQQVAELQERAATNERLRCEMMTQFNFTAADLRSAESKLAEQAAEIAANDKEAGRLHVLINAGNVRIAELEAAYLHYRPLAERTEAAERAREGACGLLDEAANAICPAPNNQRWAGLWNRIAAFLAANGGSDGR